VCPQGIKALPTGNGLAQLPHHKTNLNKESFNMHSTRRLTGFLFLGLMIFSFGVVTTTHAKGILPPPKKLSEHVYAWIGPLPGPSKENNGYRMNLVFVVGNKAVAVLDTGYTEAMAKEMLAHIKKITDKPVKYAVNTNSQPHRFMGNPAFRKAKVEIIAHAKTAARMEENGGSFAGGIERILELKEGSVKIPQAPDRIINVKDNNETTLDLGGVKVILKNFGTAHTPAQLIAHIPADNIVYTGDALYGERMLSVQSVSNTQSWLAVFEKLKTFGDVSFIPGHGHPGPLKDFDFSTRQYLSM
jgi:glyoxylase-like metal-dependent hydrolase (beta-lactamase superfamily II)